MRQRGIIFTAFMIVIGWTGSVFADSFYWYSSNSDWHNPDKWRQGSTSGPTGTVPTDALMQTSGDTLNFGDLKTNGIFANGLIYHYIVRAVNTFMIESEDTSGVSAAPAATPSLIIQENTLGFCGIDDGGSIDSNHIGLTGDGFINTENAVGEGADWNISVPVTGTYTISWRYANGSSDRPGSFLVDSSTVVASISFPATTDWDTWDEVSRTVSLSAGNRALRLEATGSGGLANIDFIKIAGADFVPLQCP